MADFYIKKGDTAPDIQGTLLDGNGEAVNLTGASVYFRMQYKQAKVAVIDSPATIVDAEGGVVKYSWLAEDTAAAGNFWAEFEVIFAGGERETFPNKGHIEVEIAANINPIS